MTTKVGRNKPCPCGSSKKYKKCCGSTSVAHGITLHSDGCLVFNSGCNDELDEFRTLRSMKWRKARNQYSCGEVKNKYKTSRISNARSILPGERHFVISFIDDNHYDTQRLCQPCGSLVASVYGDCGVVDDG